MEFPFGHNQPHHHNHHHRRPEEEENPEDLYPQPGHQPPPFAGHSSPYPPPGNQPPPFGGYPAPPPQNYYPGGPPPPVVHHVAHEGGSGGGGGFGFGHHGPTPAQEFGAGGSYVQHVAHEGGSGGGGFGFGHHGHHGPPPAQEFGAGGSYVQHVAHESGGSANRMQPTVRVYTKAEENYSLSIRDGNVVLARADHSDPYQHWIKDLRYSTKVKDEEGCPSFALINKVTGEAIKHSIGATHPVRLIRYNPNYLDESVLWAESKDLGDGFRCIRMVNNICLNFDAFHGDEDHGGVHDGTTVVLWEWLKGKNQRWKIVPY